MKSLFLSFATYCTAVITIFASERQQLFLDCGPPLKSPILWTKTHAEILSSARLQRLPFLTNKTASRCP